MNQENEIIFNELTGKKGNIGEIILNRPKALNALTFNMCRSIYERLNSWSHDPSIKAVIIKGSGDRAFCAGGDIRALYQQRDKTEEYGREFFRYEYSMNAAIFHFPKPYIAFLDGLTMGGGAGVSIHGSHRVATEKFSFAMPETLIGFFPDIGATHFLSHCPHRMGWYLGLCGETIHAADAKNLGIITHYVAAHSLEKLQLELLETQIDELDKTIVANIIKKYQIALPNAALNEYYSEIRHCFSQNSVEAIIHALQQHENEWCHKRADLLLKRSPTSLKVTFEQLNRAERMSFNEIMQMDYEIVQTYLHNHDFFEGVRALIIDKDQNPRWQPPTLSEVQPSDIAQFFRHKGHQLIISNHLSPGKKN